MAATIARARGYDRVRSKDVHRLGSEQAWAEAATWRTFAEAEIRKDGSGSVRVLRDGQELHRFEFGPEAVER